MAHSGEDEPKYSSFWNCALHLKLTFPDLARESGASSTTLPNERIIRATRARVQVNVTLK